MRSFSKNIIWMALLTSVLFSCKKNTAEPVSERLQKLWVAERVTEGGTMVYTRGSTSNLKQGYDGFRLDLSSSSAARLTDLDGHTAAGDWELSGDEKTLSLKNLNPVPTGTGGTVSFSVGGFTDDALRLSRTTASEKTGGTLNTYELRLP